MRVAINARILLAPLTGIGSYVTGLAHALQRQRDIELIFFQAGRWRHTLPETPLPGYSRLAALGRRLVPGAYSLRRAIEQRRFDAGLRRAPVDLYHEPSLWPLDFDGPMVMTLHDLTHLRHPATQPRERLAEIERRIDEGVERARRILVDSVFVGKEVADHFNLPPHRIVVAPLGCSPAFAPRDEGQTAETLRRHGLAHRRYLLCVATLEPRKNLGLALRAHAQLPDDVRARHPLLLVGMQGWKRDALTSELRTALAGGHVHLGGYLKQDDLIDIVASARALIYPSLYEGFGLPVLEAMASGTPVIVSDRAALPEVAGDAGMIVDAEDARQLADAMRRIIEDDAEWRFRREAGLIRAAGFSWERCADITAQTYRDALAD